jgi:RecB family endonuclease NucS
MPQEEVYLPVNDVTLLARPVLDEAAKALRQGLAQQRTIVVAGVCSVRYRGRARSTLEEGARLVIVKADGNVLIHRPTGLEPVNYMPSAGKERASPLPRRSGTTPGCLFETRVDGSTLILTAVQRRSRERLTIVFHDIYTLTVLSLVDSGVFALHASEKDMQRAVLDHPRLIEEGFRPITDEKRVPPGFIDVYGVDAQGRVVVVEIKRKAGSKAAALQLAKYLDVVRGDRGAAVRGVLAAPSLGRGVQTLLATLNLEFKALDPRRCAELLDRSRREAGLDAYTTSSR